jgi:hypothetical protein
VAGVARTMPVTGVELQCTPMVCIASTHCAAVDGELGASRVCSTWNNRKSHVHHHSSINQLVVTRTCYAPPHETRTCTRAMVLMNKAFVSGDTSWGRLIPKHAVMGNERSLSKAYEY